MNGYKQPTGSARNTGNAGATSGGNKGVSPEIYYNRGASSASTVPGAVKDWPPIMRTDLAGPKKKERGIINMPFIMKTMRIEAMLNEIFAQTIWVAGKTAESAVKRAADLQARDSSTIVCCLGEHIKKQDDVETMMREYTRLLYLMGARGVTTSIAVRPSPFGSDVEGYVDRGKGKTPRDYAYNNLKKLVEVAKENGVFVWIDMEGLPFSDYTLAVYKDLQVKYGNVGTVLQANVHRAEADLRSVLSDPAFYEAKHPPVIRLVKGIYRETKDAFTDYDDVHANYSNLIRIAFEESPPGTRVVVASHHDGRVLEALKLSEEHPDKPLELQVLKGVRTDLAEMLRNNGIPVTEYVPYGTIAFAYSARRMAKSPEFASTVMADMFKAVPKLVRPHMSKIVKATYPMFFGSQLFVESAKGDPNAGKELKQFLAELPARREAAKVAAAAEAQKATTDAGAAQQSGSGNGTPISKAEINDGIKAIDRLGV
ncbi:Proline dehydrogenase [Candidatus Burarchaeum australiense]|nr:Proline dehydrogenase [Candidatus Burarchaeum australiense]